MADLAPIVVFRETNCTPYGLAIEGRDCESAFDWTSSDYWRARERAERAAAKTAQSPSARAVHQELAQEYAARVRRLEGDSRTASTG
ncbi:hypothetical protein [Sphingomonas sp.]|uniref:hypothetical protein n=1 Tax=Sphingomonas sp. TaxID=28214 RepID=UPI0017E080C0|nr:hypothetical protein [Sphingomonas sp.]MBA3510648.1 hypothetical protein [Sphingomonas sp.]